jgi:hypothetical protein
VILVDLFTITVKIFLSYEKFEDTKGVIRRRKLLKDRQQNDHRRKDKQ